MCCFLGMSQVTLVIFLFLMGLLAPLVRVVRYILNQSGLYGAQHSGFNLYWFVGMVAMSAVVSMWVSFRLYWRYRLTPDKAAAVDHNVRYDRDNATITAIKVTGSALIFMAVMLMLFR